VFFLISKRVQISKQLKHLLTITQSIDENINLLIWKFQDGIIEVNTRSRCSRYVHFHYKLVSALRKAMKLIYKKHRDGVI